MTSTMPNIPDMIGFLEQHADKPFVQRILHRDQYPKLDLGNGQFATHKMSWAEVETQRGKKYVVFPTVLQEGNKLVDYGEKALPRVLKSGDFIEFDNPDAADRFSREYKSVWQD